MCPAWPLTASLARSDGEGGLRLDTSSQGQNLFLCGEWSWGWSWSWGTAAELWLPDAFHSACVACVSPAQQIRQNKEMDA